MAELYEIGASLREFLRGLLDVPGARPPPARVGGVATTSLADAREWGPRVETSGLPENYAPQNVVPFTVAPAGIDNLGLHSTDTFMIPGRGEFTIDFKGYFRVARGQPTTNDWATSEIQVNIVDLKLFGSHEATGDIAVNLNQERVSTGQIFQTTGPQEGKACRIATAVVFDVPKLGMSVFNKEPILLMNKGIKSIPPVDDPSGHALLFNVPLFDRNNPAGKAVAYLSSLRYGADHYLTEPQARAFRTRSI